MVSQRNYKIDNIKTILIFLVVLGHFYEVRGFPTSNAQYLVIYFFHMPLFSFMSGLCFKKNTKLFQNILYPYLMFQTIFLVLTAFMNGSLSELVLQYATPYWVLWYLLSLFVWSLIGNSLNFNQKSCLAVVLVSFLIAFLAGFDNSIGYYFSLSRTLIYFPFFMLGLYVKSYHFDFFNTKKSLTFKFVSIVLLLLVLVYIYINRGTILSHWLYNAVSYAACSYPPWVRLVQFIIALCFLLFFIAFTPNKSIPFITYIGSGTLNVYILHMFIVKILPLYAILSSLPYPMISTPIFAFLVVMLLASKPSKALSSVLMRWPFQSKPTSCVKQSTKV